MNKFFLLFFLLGLTQSSILQAADIKGVLENQGEAIAFAQVFLNNGEHHTLSDVQGHFTFENIENGTYTLTIQALSYQPYSQEIIVDGDVNLSINLVEDVMLIDDVVVTGTKTFKRKTNSPVIVNVLTNQNMENVQACNISEGLKFQPGLRVETDCQTCNYTQLRMNGLAGGYSQILINGRPIFSPLTGLYGLEQLPVNMVDKIEVVRGGGSSLYGSSAVGGTVNILTKIPTKNYYDVGYNYQLINNQASDHQLHANASVLSKNKKSGLSVFVNSRNRQAYDHNGDNFSELPSLKNRSAGVNFFSRPTDNQKIEISVSHLDEYRYGGELGFPKAHEASQSEERQHYVWMGSGDYQINFNEDKSSFITYLAIQNTKRSHYTGVHPDDADVLAEFLNNPPYGKSDVSTYNIGFQLNHKLDKFILGDNVLTWGGEYVYDKVYDEIPVYNYLIDQTTHNAGTFLQSDWQITNTLSILAGARLDHHNYIENLLISPRASILYKPLKNTQFRLNYAKGFRAPQAFDSDLHIAFAGGGISRVTLDENLKEERSHSWSASMNWDKVSEKYIFGYTLEGFYTQLQDGFILESVGEDEFGELFEKRNGQGASVKGMTLELRANYNRKIQLESGITVQRSLNEEEVVYIEGIQGIRDFIRTPNEYGYATLSVLPTSAWSINMNYVYTGSMIVPHFAGAPGVTSDEMYKSKAFSELSLKAAYKFDLEKLNSKMELFGGVKNIFNSYQNNFDIGKNRDSNFVFGPSQARTIYLGLKMSLL